MDSYLGEIRMFAGGYAPSNWALCDGSLLSITENAALYSLLGTAWGGDGQNNFALPDFRGRLAVGQGQGPGLTPRTLAQTGGFESAVLDQMQMPSHTHTLQASSGAATSTSPAGLAYAATQGGYLGYLVGGASPVTRPFNDQTIAPAGGSQPHSNLMPALAINFIICTAGVFPVRP